MCYISISEITRIDVWSTGLMGAAEFAVVLEYQLVVILNIIDILRELIEINR